MTNGTDVSAEDPPARRATRRPLRRSAFAFAAVGVGAVIAAGCGSSSSSTATPAGSTAAPASTSASTAAPTPAAAAAGTPVTAALTEFKIALSRTDLTPGTYTFDAVNSGKTVHALEINGPGVADQRTPGFLQPGKSANLTVTLSAGTYDVFCPVGDHKQLGMNLTLTVAGAGATAAAPAVTTAPAVTSAPAATTVPSSTSSSGSGSGY